MLALVVTVKVQMLVPEVTATHLQPYFKSKLLVFGAVSTTINDQGCPHVTGRFESIRMPLNKSAGWPTFVQSHFNIAKPPWKDYNLAGN